eukprot:5902853-Pyramimonas_sp.AAC.1
MNAIYTEPRDFEKRCYDIDLRDTGGVEKIKVSWQFNIVNVMYVTHVFVLKEAVPRLQLELRKVLRQTAASANFIKRHLPQQASQKWPLLRGYHPSRHGAIDLALICCRSALWPTTIRHRTIEVEELVSARHATKTR